MTSNTSSTGIISIIKNAVSEFSKDRCTQLSAALAYYTIFSLPPLLVLIITICGFFWNADQVSNTIMTEIEEVMGEKGAEQINIMLSNAGSSGKGPWATTISILILIITATAAVAQLQMSLNQIWDIEADPNKSSLKTTISKRIISFFMILCISFIFLLSTILTALISAFSATVSSFLGIESTFIVYLAKLGVEILIFTILFASLFKIMPDAKIKWKDVWFGALVTTILFLIGNFAIAYYLGSKEPSSTYGAAGNLVLILLWVYYSSLILFLGAEFTQAWAKQGGHQIEPDKGYLYREIHLITPNGHNDR